MEPLMENHTNYRQLKDTCEYDLDALRIFPGEVTIYEKDVLGGGMFAVVLKGKYYNLNVAIKQLRGTNRSSQEYQANLRLFRRETWMLSRIHHKHIIKLIGICTSDAQLFQVLEYMPGGSLLGQISSDRCLPDTYLISVCSQIASALEYLHSKRICHLDVAPRNVLCSGDVVKLADFGLAKDLASLEAYIWPEKRKVPLPFPPEWPSFNQRTDVWYFGALLWQIYMVQHCHVPLNELLSKENFMRAATERQPPVNAPRIIQHLIACCWQLDPDLRPSASQLLSKLDEAENWASDNVGSGLPRLKQNFYGQNICFSNSDQAGPIIKHPQVLTAAQPPVHEEQSKLVELIKKFYQDFSEVRLIPGNPHSTIRLNDVWVNLKMKDDLRADRHPGENYNICLERAKASGVPVIVQGDAGCGKSTLVKKICLDWANGHIPLFKAVLTARLRDIVEADSLFDICIKWMFNTCSDLREGKLKEEQISSELIDLGPNNILLILDGLDESSVLGSQLQKLYESEFFHSRFPVIITSRPYKVFDIRCNHKICYLLRLDLNQQIEFVKKYFRSQGTPEEARKSFLASLENNRNLHEALSVPLLLELALLTEYPGGNCRQTDLYRELLQPSLPHTTKSIQLSSLTTSIIGLNQNLCFDWAVLHLRNSSKKKVSCASLPRIFKTTRWIPYLPTLVCCQRNKTGPGRGMGNQKWFILFCIKQFKNSLLVYLWHYHLNNITLANQVMSPVGQLPICQTVSLLHFGCILMRFGAGKIQQNHGNFHS